MPVRAKGLTLIEVLLALAVLAIALTALLKITSQNIAHTAGLKEKMVSFQIAENGVQMIQSGLLKPKPGQEITQKTRMADETWYWRAVLHKTPVKHVEKITIKISRKNAGPFEEVLTAFRFVP